MVVAVGLAVLLAVVAVLRLSLTPHPTPEATLASVTPLAPSPPRAIEISLDTPLGTHVDAPTPQVDTGRNADLSPVATVVAMERASTHDDTTVASLFGLAVRTVVLDPGHGGADPGAIASDGLKEKDVTLAVALELQQLLQAQGGIKVRMTRSRDKSVSLARRVAIANETSADLFVSIHVNRLLKSHVNAVETYYFGAPPDAETRALAELENQGSELPLSAFRDLVARLGNTLKRQESRALAESIQASLVRASGTETDIFDSGTKVAPFVVLLGVDAPSILAEIACLSNPFEAQHLATAKYRKLIAERLFDGIIRYLTDRKLNAYGAVSHGPNSLEGADFGKSG